MPTLEQWVRALSKPRTAKLISDDALVVAVNSRPNSKTFSGTRKIASKIESVAPFRHVQVTPAEILGSIGIITTPRIANLADISSTWARMRYIWAFHPSTSGGNTNLRLSNAALNLDFHQKTLLSDEMGIGFASLIMERYFGAVNPVDVDVALRKRKIKGLKKQGAPSPDYIFGKVNDPNDFFVVECKGTQTDYSQSVAQIARGTEQVTSLKIGKKAIDSFVVATHLSEHFTNVYIVDPPSEDGGDSDIVISEQYMHEFYQSILNEQRKNILRYIGAVRVLLLDDGEGTFQVEADPTVQPREEIMLLGHTYVGTSSIFRVPGDSVELRVFQGVNSLLYQYYLGQSYQELVFALGKMYERVLSATDFPGTWMNEARSLYFERWNDGVNITYIRKEGTVFQISVLG